MIHYHYLYYTAHNLSLVIDITNNFIYSNTDSAGYYRIRMWNQIEKIDKNKFGCIHFTTTFEFECGYRYPYLYFSTYGYRIIRISFPSLKGVVRSGRKKLGPTSTVAGVVGVGEKRVNFWKKCSPNYDFYWSSTLSTPQIYDE
jgi:hypothetical protein